MEVCVMSDSRLYVTVGLPYSGKSTWARSTGYPIVCPDSIRLSLHGSRFVWQAEPFVWSIAKVMVASLFESGHENVVLDGCFISKKRRAEWNPCNGPEAKLVSTVFIPIETSLTTCLERAAGADDAPIVPVIERMSSEFEPLGSGEACLAPGVFRS